MKERKKSLSRVRLFATPWTIAYQAPPSMGFSRQEYCSGLPLPSPWVMWEGPKCNHKRAHKENMERDFPNGLVVENMVANAGVTGLVPLGRSHMLWSSRTCVPKLLSLCSRAHKLQLLNHTLQQKKPLQ